MRLIHLRSRHCKLTRACLRYQPEDGQVCVVGAKGQARWLPVHRSMRQQVKLRTVQEQHPTSIQSLSSTRKFASPRNPWTPPWLPCRHVLFWGRLANRYSIVSQGCTFGPAQHCCECAEQYRSPGGAESFEAVSLTRATQHMGLDACRSSAVSSRT